VGCDVLFCGALNFEDRAVSFSDLKKMYGPRRGGTAFVNREIGIICDSDVQPLTVSYNSSLYTAAIVSSLPIAQSTQNLAQSVLGGYFEEGDSYVRRMDFPFALALYDSRCGELLLSKGAVGDKALFYTQRDGTVYFASSI
jgi:asparagine synthetase B (glutamine-hydrolysing)